MLDLIGFQAVLGLLGIGFLGEWCFDLIILLEGDFEIAVWGSLAVDY